MTISYQWLSDFITLDMSPDELGEMLTGTGLEVESISSFESVRGNLKGLVIGQVLTCERHPNADKLSLTTVDVGESSLLRIVCGAPNVAAGQKVIVATPGATLYPIVGEPFSIKSTRIRGEVSEGMICAEDEIGVGNSHEGIMVLDTTLPNGTPAASYFQLSEDHVFEIGLTPNRADAASHLGVARDIRAVTGREILRPDVSHFAVSDTSLSLTVKVENKEACLRYSGVGVTGLTVGESPRWLKNRLAAIGLSPINNVVDITNYVCHELGQPLHAFDAAKIRGQQVVVKNLPEGTDFVTLDGKERKLTSHDLMICDAEGGMCIAGVFGGIDSGVTAGTTSVFLESACFAPSAVRKTTQHHQLKTDSSFRFERGTDPEGTVYALKRAALLLVELCGGSISSEITDIYPTRVEPNVIEVKDKNVNRLIGKVIPREKIFQILERLDIDVVSKDEDRYTVSVPPYRVDIVQEADIVEEALRIYGFNNIELTDHAQTSFLAAFPDKDFNKFKRAVGEMLAGNGFLEMWTNSLTNQEYQSRHNLKFPGEPVELLNKLSEELGVMRQSLFFTGLEVCAYNINRRQRDLKLFEFGKIYFRKDGKTCEQERLSMFMTGSLSAEHWDRTSAPVTYHDLAQQMQNVMIRCGVSDTQTERLNDPMYEYGLSIRAAKQEIGRAGKLNGSILKEFGIKQDLFYADLDASLLFNVSNPKFVIQDVPRFPEVRRDLSLVIDKRVTFEELQDLVRSIEKRLIKSIVVFDVYEGDKIPQDKKAYAMGFTLQDVEKTLTDEEIDKTMNRLMTAFEKQLGAIIRR